MLNKPKQIISAKHTEGHNLLHTPKLLASVFLWRHLWKPIVVSSKNRWKTWEDEEEDGKSRRWSLGGLEPSPPFPPLPLPPPLPFPVSVKDPNSSSEFPEHVLVLAWRDDGDSAVMAGISEAGDVTNAEQTVSSQISGSSPAVASHDVVEYRQWRWWLTPEVEDVDDWGE